mgnify:FL=1
MTWEDILKAPLNRDEAQSINRKSIEPLIDRVDEIIRERLAGGDTRAWITTRGTPYQYEHLEVGSPSGGNQTITINDYISAGSRGVYRDVVMGILYRVWQEESDAEVKYDSDTIQIKFSEDIEYRDLN